MTDDELLVYLGISFYIEISMEVSRIVYHREIILDIFWQRIWIENRQ